MQTFWIAYLLAAPAACVLFAVAGWRSRRLLNVSFNRLEPFNEGFLYPGASHRCDKLADVAEAIAIAIKRLTPVIANQSVHIDVAVRRGIHACLRCPQLAGLLEELLTVAVRGAPAGAVLLTASEHGDHINICITDDMPATDPVLRQAQVRQVAERVTQAGGTLNVSIRRGEGTTMTLCIARSFEVSEAFDGGGALGGQFAVSAAQLR